MNPPAKVYLVGAGPGHPDLLTLKAARLLETADVIVYDRLVQEEVLARARPSAERIFMGKSVGRHARRQDEVHELLVRKAREGRTVVRLKGGDPFVFGRGGEEAEHLAAHGIPFEVVPGVSSAFAAPLSAGIPVTHRDLASAVAIVAGHESARDETRVDWPALARMDTLVVLMGVANAADIAARLVAAGRDPDTPAAVIQMAFWHDERVVTATLGTIAGAVAAAGLRPPATLVVGEVVRLREKLAGAARDLRRRADAGTRFEPAPGADEVLRLATGAVGSQVLGFALDAGLFDRLESPCAAVDLAAATGVDAPALEEILGALVAIGLVESADGGYRNLEIASRYLTRDSPQSLVPTLLHEVALVTSWTDLGRFVRTGPPASPSGGAPHDETGRLGAEAFARFAAPAVVDRFEVEARGPMLHVGWGGLAYAGAIGRRWPGAAFTTCNPFLTAGPRPSLDAVRGSGPYGTVLASGLLASCRPDAFDEMLRDVAAMLDSAGALVLHEAFLPDDALPPAGVVLGALARRAFRGEGGAWTVGRVADRLRGLGLTTVRAEPLVAGTWLVRAERSTRR